MKTRQIILETHQSRDYELIDSGNGEKLERYGKIVIARPDPQALWHKKLNESEWRKADAVFSPEDGKSGWQKKTGVPEKWEIELAGLNFFIKLSAFKHTGIFPEQSENWKWIEKTIASEKRKISILNLFGYTGGATLAAAKAGAEVCHLDGSKTAIEAAKSNAKLSGLADKPIRWILDDALDFLRREIKRGRKYDGIIMDPPAFGHGPEGQLWKIEKNFLELLGFCEKVLSKEPALFIINGYASGYSSVAYKNNLEFLMGKFGGSIEFGELTIKESGGDERLLPCGIFARWSSSVGSTE